MAERDATGDTSLKRAIDTALQQYGDRWPIRGQANVPPREYRPFEDVSRGGRMEEYKKRPNAKS